MDPGGWTFRKRLERELPGWIEDGIVDEVAAAKLKERYRADASGTSLAMMAVYVLGGLLIGGGIISLVAYNWDVIPEFLQLTLTMTVMLAAHVGGYVLWKARASKPALGHALVLIGTLMLGANIGLAAQIFHVSSNGYNGVGAWALGAIVVAWIYRSGPVAALTVVLGAVYSVGLMDHLEHLVPFPAFALAAIFLPMAWLNRSRALFVWVLVTCVITHCIVIEIQGREEGVVMFLLLISAALLAWSFTEPKGEGARFVGPARVLSFACLGVVGYALSFHELADEMRFTDLDTNAWLAIAPAALAAVVAFGWALEKRFARLWEHPATAAGVIGAVLICAAVFVEPQELWVAVAANAMLVGLSASAVAVSVRGLERLPFWSGSLLGGLLIVSRFFEFDTELWLKGLAFIACGGAVISVGILFERRVKAEGERHAA